MQTAWLNLFSLKQNKADLLCWTPSLMKNPGEHERSHNIIALTKILSGYIWSGSCCLWFSWESWLLLRTRCPMNVTTPHFSSVVMKCMWKKREITHLSKHIFTLSPTHTHTSDIALRKVKTWLLSFGPYQLFKDWFHCILFSRTIMTSTRWQSKRQLIGWTCSELTWTR